MEPDTLKLPKTLERTKIKDLEEKKKKIRKNLSLRLYPSLQRLIHNSKTFPKITVTVMLPKKDSELFTQS